MLPLAGLLLSVGLDAVPGAARPPVRIDAEEVRYSYKERTVTFVGRPAVKMTREDSTLSCRQAVADNDAEGRIVGHPCGHLYVAGGVGAGGGGGGGSG